MSILIKGMEMPKNCYECKFALARFDPLPTQSFKRHEFKCVLTEKALTATKRNKACPLIEIPPHGRLIDADALMREFEKAQNTMKQHGQEYSCSFLSTSQEISTEWYCVEDILDNAPTVIETENE